RLGSRGVVSVAAALSATGFTVAGISPTIWGAGLALAFAGLSWGVWDVGMNVQGHYVERARGRQLMPRYHACWSARTILGSAVGAFLARHHAPVGWHFVTAGVTMFVVCVVAARWFLPDRADSPAAAAATDDEHLPFWKVLDTRLLLIG